MYDNTARIQQELSTFKLGFCGKLDPENRWIKMAGMIPWDLLEPEYSHHFNNTGRPAKRFRVALGTLIVQQTLKLTDRETVELISENPYVQFFLGFPEFQAKIPFDSSLLVYFRKRLSWESIAKINELIVKVTPPEPENAQVSSDGDDNDKGSGVAEETLLQHKMPVQGTLILDATCCPADIRHPQDLSLIDEARRKTEEIIDAIHAEYGNKKPRTDRLKARVHFLSVIRKRQKLPIELQKATRKQLGYLNRNLRTIDQMVKLQDISWPGKSALQVLSRQQFRNLLVVQEFYKQQRYMLTLKTRKVPDRIVSISQPHVRPIIRGKARSDTEFGAKISVAVHDGMVFVDRMSFDAYSESHDVEMQAEAYRSRTGHYPASILADKAYQNRANRQWCQDRGIRLMGNKLGRPFENPAMNRLFKRFARMDEIQRVEIEGRIGIQKRRYGWDLIKGKKQESAMTMIMLVALVANLAQGMRGIHLALFRFLYKESIKINNLRMGINCWSNQLMVTVCEESWIVQQALFDKNWNSFG